MVTDGSDNTSYPYDTTYQLTKVTYPGGAVHEFAYDASGNRTDWDITGGVSYDYYYDSADQLTNSTVNGTPRTYEYDGNGAMSAHGTRKHACLKPARGRLARSELASNAEVRHPANLGPWYGSGGSPRDAESCDTTYQYSVVNQLTKIINPEGDVSEFEFDAAGHRTKLKYGRAPRPQGRDGGRSLDEPKPMLAVRAQNCLPPVSVCR